jgi:hypothetical protein
MAISVSDIEFFLSGGSTNSNPNNSIGGLPSGFLVLGSANNLFSDLSSETVTAGRTDYRCFYIANGNSTESLRNVEIFFSSQSSGGSSVQMGVQTSTEIQRISIAIPAYFGSLVMRYESTTFTVPWGLSPSDFKVNLQYQLSLTVPGTTVSMEVQDKYYFTISFLGDSNNRSHPLLEVVENNLQAPVTPTVSVTRVAGGGPINSIAPVLSVDTVSPARVLFYSADESSKLSIGTLKSGDKIPVWIKRVTGAGVDYLESDYFDFRIKGTSG